MSRSYGCCMFSSLVDKCPGAGYLGYKGKETCVQLWWTLSVFQGGGTILAPTAAGACHLLHILTSTWCYWTFHFSPANGTVVHACPNPTVVWTPGLQTHPIRFPSGTAPTFLNQSFRPLALDLRLLCFPPTYSISIPSAESSFLIRS